MNRNIAIEDGSMNQRKVECLMGSLAATVNGTEHSVSVFYGSRASTEGLGGRGPEKPAP
jgi:hypothetical protein